MQKIKIFYKVCDKKSRTIKAIFENKEHAHQYAQKDKNFFVAVGWDYVEGFWSGFYNNFFDCVLFYNKFSKI